MTSNQNPNDPVMNPDELYAETSYTDRKVGNIRQLTPVKSDGSPDTGRATLYIGQSQILTPMGALPITFEIPAQSLAEAVEGFSAGAKIAIEETLNELQEMRRESASSIVIPGTESQSKIQLR